MTGKPIIPRAQARRDVDAAIDFYLAENAEQAALGFVDALEQAFVHIGRDPATGSPRYGQTLRLDGLRSWLLTPYPFLVFYVDRDHHVDVWRVLHSRRDVPLRLQDAGG